MKIIALVPMRHNSERVPGKNYRIFAGRPLFHFVVESLLACREIDEVVIDTDSPAIKKETRRHFPAVTIFDRPEHLRGGSIPMNEVLLHTTERIAAAYYLQTHSTNPLLSSATISRAIRVFLENCREKDSLFSVKRLNVRLWDAAGRPMNHDPAKLVRTQDLPHVFEENSCIYIFDRKTLERRRNRIGETPLLFEMDSVESMDIDDETDFRIAELLYANRDKILENTP